MNSSKILIIEGENSNLDRFNILQKNAKKNSFFNIKIIIIIFIIIFFLFFNLNENLIKNFHIIINQKIIKQLNFIKVKLQILEENQKMFSKKKIITNYNDNIYYLLSTMEVLGFNKIRIGRKADGGYIFLNDFKNIKIA